MPVDWTQPQEWATREGTKYRSAWGRGPEDIGNLGFERFDPNSNQWLRMGGESFYAQPNTWQGQQYQMFSDPTSYFNALGGGPDFSTDASAQSFMDKMKDWTSKRLYESQMRSAAGSAAPGATQEDEYLAKLRQQAYGAQHDRPWNPSDASGYPTWNPGESSASYQQRLSGWKSKRQQEQAKNPWQQSGNYYMMNPPSQEAAGTPYSSKYGGKWGSLAGYNVNKKIEEYEKWRKGNPTGNVADFEKKFKPWTVKDGRLVDPNAMTGLAAGANEPIPQPQPPPTTPPPTTQPKSFQDAFRELMGNYGFQWPPQNPNANPSLVQNQGYFQPSRYGSGYQPYQQQPYQPYQQQPANPNMYNASGGQTQAPGSSAPTTQPTQQMQTGQQFYMQQLAPIMSMLSGYRQMGSNPYQSMQSYNPYQNMGSYGYQVNPMQSYGGYGMMGNYNPYGYGGY